MLQINTKAPDFTLPDEKGVPHTLSAYLGTWVLLYFYPKDDTPGCTKEACMLRDYKDIYKENDLVVLGVSKDDSESHEAFISKYKLPFTLLADTNREVIEIYGASGTLFTKRISYLIDPNGIIQKVYEKVEPETHAAEVLRDVAMLKQNS